MEIRGSIEGIEHPDLWVCPQPPARSGRVNQEILGAACGGQRPW